jgi:hypothetical protein
MACEAMFATHCSGKKVAPPPSIRCFTALGADHGGSNDDTGGGVCSATSLLLPSSGCYGLQAAQVRSFGLYRAGLA